MHKKVSPPPIIEQNAQIYTQTLSTQATDFVFSNGAITKYTGSGGNVVIPSTIDGRTVYGIGEKAFQNVTSIDSVTMPSTLERIEGYAFSGCSNLRTVNLNEGLEYLGRDCFALTTNLRDIWIPSTVVEFARGVFYRSGLTSAYVPATVRIFGTHVFQECSRLTDVIFMADIDELPEATFLKSPVLTNVYLREGIVTIGVQAFNECTGLKEITLPSTTTTINNNAFTGCSKLEKMDMSNTVLKEICYRAFNNCDSLKEVILPYGFLQFSGQNYSRGPYVFVNCPSLEKLVAPSTVTKYYTDSSSYSYTTTTFETVAANFTIYSYSDTVSETYAASKNINFSSLGSVSSEKQPTIVPTTPPELPTKPDVTTPTVTPEVELPAVSQDMSSKVASPSDVKVKVNGVTVSFAPYAIDGFNYFKLTDMAYALNNTASQFEVTWDANAGAINMKMGNSHIMLGTELQGNSGATETAERLTGPVLKNNSIIDVVVYSINGSSYFQLDTLKGVLGIDVGWDATTGTITIVG